MKPDAFFKRNPIAIDSRDIYNTIAYELNKRKLFSDYFKSRGLDWDAKIDPEDLCQFFFDSLPRYTKKQFMEKYKTSMEPQYALSLEAAMKIIKDEIYEAVTKSLGYDPRKEGK